MPFPTVPPATQPPTNDIPAQENNFSPQQSQNQFVTPSETNTTSNQEQQATGTGTGVSNATASPNIYGASSLSNTVVNSGYGENSEECMENVGCRTVPAIDFIAYYGRNTVNNNVDNNYYSSSGNNNAGVALRVVVPLGNGFNGNLNKVAEQETLKRIQEVKAQQQKLIADQIALDEQIVKSCVNLKNTVNGKTISINPENASPVIRRSYEICQGLDVIIASAPPTDTRNLEAENAFLRQKIEQLMRQKVPQKIGN